MALFLERVQVPLRAFVRDAVGLVVEKFVEFNLKFEILGRSCIGHVGPFEVTLPSPAFLLR